MQSISAPTRLAETRRRVRVPYAVLAVSLLSTAAAALYVGAEASENDRAHFQNLADRTQGSIARRIDSYITVLRGTSGLFAASDKILAAEFRAYVSRLAIEEKYPGVQGVGASLRIAAQHKAPTVASIRQQPGLEDFDIKPADPRPEYHAILYLEPLDARNRRAIGYDMFTEPTRRAAMERARSSRTGAVGQDDAPPGRRRRWASAGLPHLPADLSRRSHPVGRRRAPQTAARLRLQPFPCRRPVWQHLPRRIDGGHCIRDL